jgi:hypothetical protein
MLQWKDDYSYTTMSETGHRGCKHQSPLSQTCLAEGYDDRPLFGWNPDPFANFNPNRSFPKSTSEEKF